MNSFKRYSLQTEHLAYKHFQEYSSKNQDHIDISLCKIDLSYLELISNSSVCLLVDSCPKLDQITITGCSRLLEWYNKKNEEGGKDFVSDGVGRITLSRIDVIKRKLLDDI